MVLPELLPWPGENRPADIAVVFDRALPDNLVSPSRRLDASGNLHLCFTRDTCLVISPAGDRVEVHAAEGSDPLVVRNYLYGSGLAALCFRRGMLPLHASAVRIGNFAVIIAGQSGAGKSTLATALAMQGHALLCDDVCALDFADAAGPLLRPAFPRVKLLADAVEEFALSSRTEFTMGLPGEKKHFGVTSIASGEHSGAVAVAAIYVLSPRRGEATEATQVKGASGFQTLREHVHRLQMGRALGCSPTIFAQLAALAERVPIRRLQRPEGLRLLKETVRYLEQRHSGQGPLDGTEASGAPA